MSMRPAVFARRRRRGSFVSKLGWRVIEIECVKNMEGRS